ncbi:MAG: hypothetical protein SPI64_06920 [Anaerovibrio sp.]|nr:hypothetical protein [Selenomonadaceae bacterium]MDD6397186.1 hypothetical protein [Selenomonadaceae bacterium]MDY6053835.1 hypothetical protein [Anaerovibrio sp.]
MAIRENVKGVSYDGLIGGTEVPIIEKNISITAGTALERGSVVTEAGKLVTGADEASYVVSQPVTAEDTVATVYASGMFNAEHMIVGESDTVAAHAAQLRDKNIYLTSEM